MKIYRRVAPIFLFLALALFYVFLCPKTFAQCTDADCSPGYACQSGTMCCTNGGCPSYACTLDDFEPMKCDGQWTCCYHGNSCAFNCVADYFYQTGWGTCSYCDGSSGGGTGAAYAVVSGEIWTDLNSNDVKDAGERWKPSNEGACAGSLLNPNNFSLRYQSTTYGTDTNAMLQWICGPYWRSEKINGGTTVDPTPIRKDGETKATFTLQNLPPGYTCSDVSWQWYVDNNATLNTSGIGCIAQITGSRIGDSWHNFLDYKLQRPGQVIGRVWTDANGNGATEKTELWAGNNSNAGACINAGLINNFTITEQSTSANLLNPAGSWGCNTLSGVSAPYYLTSNFQSGVKTLALGNLPAGYVGNEISKITWRYVHPTDSSKSRSGIGNIANNIAIPEGGIGNLWWMLALLDINTAPTVTVPAPITYTYSDPSFIPLTIDAQDSNAGGTLKIVINPGTGTFPTVNSLRFRAYGTPAVGVWPTVQLHGWRASDGLRVPIGLPKTVSVPSATPSDYVFSVTGGPYSMFDLEFTNDVVIGSEDRNVFVDWVEYITSIGTYHLEFENPVIKIDRGIDNDDGQDVVAASLFTPFAGLTAAACPWPGAYRLPALWRPPYQNLSAVSNASINVTVTDEGNLTATGNITTNPAVRNVSGHVYDAGNPFACTTIPSVFLDTTVTLNSKSGTTRPGVPNSRTTLSGQYTLSGQFEPIISVGYTAIPGYSIACMNGSAGNNNPISVPVGVAQMSGTIDIGFQPMQANDWVAGYGGVISASNYPNKIMPSSQPGGTFTVSGISHYLYGYSSPSKNSTIFSKESIGGISDSTYSDSRLSFIPANNKDTFRTKNNEFFVRLASLIRNLRDDADITKYSSLPISFTGGSISVYTGTNIPNGFVYTTSNVYTTNDLAIIVVPKANDSDNTPLVINDMQTLQASRVLILTDREVHLGQSDQGTDMQVTLRNTPNRDVKASIISTENIVVDNFGAAENAFVVDGPLISGKNIIISRDLTDAKSQYQPSLYVSYNTAYVQTLNYYARHNTLPKLNGLFMFDLTQTEQ